MTIIFGLILNSLLDGSHLYLFIGKVVLITVFYSFILWAIGLNLGEKQLMFNVLKRFFNLLRGI